MMTEAEFNARVAMSKRIATEAAPLIIKGLTALGLTSAELGHDPDIANYLLGFYLISRDDHDHTRWNVVVYGDQGFPIHIERVVPQD